MKCNIINIDDTNTDDTNSIIVMCNYIALRVTLKPPQCSLAIVSGSGYVIRENISRVCIELPQPRTSAEDHWMKNTTHVANAMADESRACTT